MDAIDALAKLVQSIIEGLSKRGRFMLFIFSFLILSLIFFYFESHSRLLYYISLERRIALVKQLNQLAKDDILLNNETAPIYSELAEEILSGKVTPMELPTITTLVLYKFLTGACFGLLFLIIGLVSRRPKAIRGASVVAAFFGIVAVFIPILGSIWVNLIILMLIQLLLLTVTPKRPDVA